MVFGQGFGENRIELRSFTTLNEKWTTLVQRDQRELQKALALRAPFVFKTNLDRTQTEAAGAFWGGQKAQVELPNGFDQALLQSIYSLDSGLSTAFFGSTDRIAYPVIFGIPVVSLVLMATDSGVSNNEAAQLTISWVGAAGMSTVLKHLVKRGRPYTAVSGISPKITYVGARGLSETASFPSGHAALSFAMATSISLLHPRWEVFVPSAFVASSISLSRIWLGVHYPSDVLAGAGLGIGTALLVHTLLAN